MIKEIIRSFLPPIIITLFNKLNSQKSLPLLFDGDDELFKKVLKKAKVYGEYGCGESTKWVLENCDVKVISVDTSQDWVEEVKKEVSNLNNLEINYINLGELGEWGTPISYSQSDLFHLYTDFLWKNSLSPDVVLIDGRFRVACFLSVLKFAQEGTYIIFDDYTNRPSYHYIEKYVDRLEECGRQCLFKVPSASDLDFKSLEDDIKKFRFVMD